MLGSIAIANEDFDEKGWVRAFSENWSATSDRPVKKGDKLRVIGVDGLTLKVDVADDSTETDEE